MANENNTQANVSQTLLGANDRGRVSYEVNGETINLSFQIVRNFITRGSKDVSDAECIMFISLCKANKLKDGTTRKVWTDGYIEAMTDMLLTMNIECREADGVITIDGQTFPVPEKEAFPL